MEDADIHVANGGCNPPRVFLSYSHESQEHSDRVLRLANRLRKDGIDAWLDRYEPSPDSGWARWMVQELKRADWILAICTATYKTRFEGVAETGGQGVAWEGAILTKALYERKRMKILPVLFGDKEACLPTVLSDFTRVDYFSEGSYENLYRYLTGQSGVEVPPIGESRKLPPQETRWSPRPDPSEETIAPNEDQPPLHGEPRGTAGESSPAASTKLWWFVLFGLVLLITVGGLLVYRLAAPPPLERLSDGSEPYPGNTLVSSQRVPVSQLWGYAEGVDEETWTPTGSVEQVFSEGPEIVRRLTAVNDQLLDPGHRVIKYCDLGAVRNILAQFEGGHGYGSWSETADLARSNLERCLEEIELIRNGVSVQDPETIIGALQWVDKGAWEDGAHYNIAINTALRAKMGRLENGWKQIEESLDLVPADYLGRFPVTENPALAWACKSLNGAGQSRYCPNHGGSNTLER